MGKNEDQQHDDSVDTTPAEPIEETPDSTQDAEPVENVGEVVGRRNTELPLDNQRPRDKS